MHQFHTIKLPFLFVVLLCSLSCSNQESAETVRRKDSSPDQQNSHKAISNKNWEEYSNQNLLLMHPPDWKVWQSRKQAFEQISVVMDSVPEAEIPSLKIHAQPGRSFVSIFPNGFGTELPAGKSRKISDKTPLPELGLKINKEKSRVFLLENDSVWAYIIYPSLTPAAWSEDAFIFAQIGVDSFRAVCRDHKTGQPISMNECEPLEGDHYERYGILKKYQAERIKSILGTINFTGTQKQINEELQVSTPDPKAVVHSPLLIKGKARGTWFFEGKFTVRLVTTKSKELANGVASAQANWMTEDLVPFEANLEFKKPAAQSGFLIFEKANPSGLAENRDSYRQKILFE